jgi:anti-sigma factor RsiW
MPLGALIDGELSGAERLRVSEHLATCAACAGQVEDVRSLGDLLRAAAESTPVQDLGGLAGGVISRIRAERAQSWRALLERAVDGWHWFLVGGGSCSAAAMSILFVSALLQFGPAPERDDSLSALLQNRNWHVVEAPVGQMYVWAESVPMGKSHPADLALIGAFSDALGSQGKPIDLRGMPTEERLYAETLAERIREERSSTTTPSNLAVYKIQLITSTAVSSKGI